MQQKHFPPLFRALSILTVLLTVHDDSMVFVVMLLLKKCPPAFLALPYLCSLLPLHHPPGIFNLAKVTGVATPVDGGGGGAGGRDFLDFFPMGE